MSRIAGYTLPASNPAEAVSGAAALLVAIYDDDGGDGGGGSVFRRTRWDLMR